ncbi:MAG: 4-(cytidine 5'-diphospho)-2-C-methyl-D-erythritol kinase [Chloroflexi bacterium]|nr:4-(cytidine 5'-diphospho)-2-C-methyl-D-erythritol kinase [Chloroflexota bacterium]
MLTVLAPAKINLTLEVLAKREDGFHEIRSVIQTAGLCDRLRFESAENLEIKCDMPGWVAEESLVSRAARRLQQAAGCSEGARIEVEKRLPLMSGLGGDSSDAAATLRGLNRLWGLGLPLEKLVELASGLGSDVPFFVYGGTALIEGRGEKVTPLPPPPTAWIMLVVPAVPRLPGKTAQLYASLSASHFTDGRITGRLAAEIRAGRQIEPSLLFNTFENVAFARFSELGTYREHMVKVGAADVHLAGSGPTLFTLVHEKSRAEELYLRLRQQRLEVYLVETPAPMDRAG